MLRKYLKNRGK